MTTKTCRACNVEVVQMGSVTFRSAHPNCANDRKPVGLPCPVCGADTVWCVAKYGAFPACSKGVFVGGGQCKGKIHGKTDISKSKAKAAAEGGAPTPEAPEAKETPEETPEPAPIPAATPAPSGNAASEALWALVGPAARAEIANVAQQAAAKVASEIAGKSVTVEIKLNGEAFGKADPTMHVLVKDVLEALAIMRAAGDTSNVLVVGPAGSGKTTLARDVSKAISARRFAAVSCSAGMSESKIEGRLVPKIATGEDVYRSTDFVDVYTHGGVFLFDEIDAADSNVLLVINAALANGHMSTPNGEIARHTDAIIICAANTYGTGADRVYVGRNQLDGAFLDRFVGMTFDVAYDTEIEKRWCPDAAALAKVWAIREKANALKLRRVVGTRMVRRVGAYVASGWNVDRAIKRCLVGWTSDELSKVGVRS